MKKLTLLFLLIPFFIDAQTVVTLNVNQPPEFGFEVSKQDTTIIIGNSIELGSDVVVIGGTGEYQYSWSPAEFLDDSTIINPVANPTDTTIYVLTVYDNNGCSFSVNYTVNVREVGVSIQDIDKDESSRNVILYPNPNNGLFKVQLNGFAGEDIKLIVIDNTGKYIHNKSIPRFTREHTETLQLKLIPGTYFLEVVSKDTKLHRQFIIH